MTDITVYHFLPYHQHSVWAQVPNLKRRAHLWIGCRVSPAPARVGTPPRSPKSVWLLRTQFQKWVPSAVPQSSTCRGGDSVWEGESKQLKSCSTWKWPAACLPKYGHGCIELILIRQADKRGLRSSPSTFWFWSFTHIWIDTTLKKNILWFPALFGHQIYHLVTFQSSFRYCLIKLVRMYPSNDCRLAGIIGKLSFKLCHQRHLVVTLQVIVLTLFIIWSNLKATISGCFQMRTTILKQYAIWF